ncbi:MAG: class I SAM-dependent methyltransferase [Gaiellaceae bacterium]
MLAAAERQVAKGGWQNVELRQGDAAHLELGHESLDGALCTFGLGAIPDHGPAIANVAAALRPGGRFVVLDGKPFDGLGRPLNPIMKPAFRYVSNWHDRDLPADLRLAFADVAVRQFNGGSLLLAAAAKDAAPATRPSQSTTKA